MESCFWIITALLDPNSSEIIRHFFFMILVQYLLGHGIVSFSFTLKNPFIWDMSNKTSVKIGTSEKKKGDSLCRNACVGFCVHRTFHLLFYCCGP